MERQIPPVSPVSPVVRVVPRPAAAPPGSRYSLAGCTARACMERQKTETKEMNESLKSLQYLIPDVSSSCNLSLSNAVQDCPNDPVLAGIMALKLELESVQMARDQLLKEREYLLMECPNRIHRQTQKNIALGNEIEELRKRIKEETEKEDKMEKELASLRPINGNKDETFESVARVKDEATKKLVQLRYMNKSIELRRSQLVGRLLSKEQERRKLQTELLTLKGPLRTIIKVTEDEDENKNKNSNSNNHKKEIEGKDKYMKLEYPDRDMDMKLLEIVCPDNSSRIFECERVLSPVDGEENFFKIINPIVQCVIDGYNFCILSTGVSCRSVDTTTEELFSHVYEKMKNIVEARKEDGWTSSISVKKLFIPVHEDVSSIIFEEKEIFNNKEETSDSSDSINEILSKERKTETGSTLTIITVTSTNEIFGKSVSPQEGHFYILSLSPEETTKQVTDELNLVLDNAFCATREIRLRGFIPNALNDCLEGNTRSLVIVSISTSEKYLQNKMTNMRLAMSFSSSHNTSRNTTNQTRSLSASNFRRNRKE